MRQFLNLSAQKEFKWSVKRLDGVLYAKMKQSKKWLLTGVIDPKQHVGEQRGSGGHWNTVGNLGNR